VRGAVERPTTEPIVLDIALPAGQRFEAAIPPGTTPSLRLRRRGRHRRCRRGDPGRGRAHGAARQRREAGGVRLAAPEGVPARVLLVAGGRSASRSRSTGRS
jgi:hypothetical protein